MSRTAVRALLIAGVIASGSFAIVAPAIAAEDPPTCGEAVLALSDATKLVVTARTDDAAVIAAEKLYTDLTRAEVELAASVKADNDTRPGLPDSQRTVDAKAAQVKAKAAVDAFVALGKTLVQLRATAELSSVVDLEKLRVTAKLVADKACKGADAPTTAPVPTPAPQVIVVPNTDQGVDTGSWAFSWEA